MNETFFKTFHLNLPFAFSYQWTRADYENGTDITPGLQLTQNRPCLNGFPYTNAFGNE